MQAHLPNPAERKVGTPFGATVARFKSGMSIVADAKASLAAMKVAQPLLQEFAERMEAFRAFIPNLFHTESE